MKHSLEWDEPNGCVRMTLVDEFAPAEADELLRRTEQLWEGKRHRYLLVDHTLSPAAVSRDTRAALEHRAAQMATEKIAFYGMTNLNRMITRIIITIIGKSGHTQFFASEAEALAWLHEHS